MVKNRYTVLVMAIIGFILMPFTISRGAANLLENWKAAESIMANIIPYLPSFLSTYFKNMTIQYVQHNFSLFKAAMRGLGFATLIYSVSKKDYWLGAIIAAIADGVSLVNRIFEISGWSVNGRQIAVLAIPFAMWFCAMLVEEIINGKNKALVLALFAILTYWCFYSYLEMRFYFSLHFVITASFAILGSVAMQQMDM